MYNLPTQLKTQKAEKNTQETQARKFILPEFSATKIVTWKYHVDNSNNRRYDMILRRYLPTTPGLDLKFSENVILGREVPCKGCSSPMVDIGNYDFNIITAKTVKPEESFINLYVCECLKSESKIRSTRIMHKILETKYKKADLNMVMTKQCQHQNTN